MAPNMAKNLNQDSAHSAILVTNNEPVSIFKSEKGKTTKMPKTPTEPTPEQTPEETAPVAETPIANDQTQLDAENELERLEAEQKANAERIKALKAAMPKLSPLEKIIRQQTANPGDVLAQSRVVGRMKAGQTKAEAIAAVLELTRAWLEANITEQGAGE
jgi:hypothetical protein